MPFTGVVEPEQLSVLRQALGEYCLTQGISDEQGRNHAAWLVMLAFTNGANIMEELRTALDTHERRRA